jgi:flagella basal body P-ring formation protein FlgA
VASTSTSPPQLTWTNVVATITVMCVLAAGGYTIVENQFAFVQQSARQANEDLLKQLQQIHHELELIQSQYLTLREHAAYQKEQENANNAFRTRIGTMEAIERDLLSHSAHSPVEAKEVDVFSAATDKRFEAVQQQINDINRQIAASILTPGGVLHLQQPPLQSSH